MNAAQRNRAAGLIAALERADAQFEEAQREAIEVHAEFLDVPVSEFEEGDVEVAAKHYEWRAEHYENIAPLAVALLEELVSAKTEIHIGVIEMSSDNGGDPLIFAGREWLPVLHSVADSLFALDPDAQLQLPNPAGITDESALHAWIDDYKNADSDDHMWTTLTTVTL